MSDEEKSKSWWHTLPGVITSPTGAITALAGLVVALQQTGWFGTAPTTTTASISTPAASSGAVAPLAPAQDVSLVTPPSSPAGSSYSVGLPEMRDYRLGTATFTVLSAEVSPRTAEKDALQVRIRMMNHDRYPVNFWDQSFRLVLNGVPMAPESNLNELVEEEAAKEGDVLFVVPRGTTGGALRITYHDESTEFPLALGSPR